MKEDKIRVGKLINIDDRLLEISEKLLDLGFTKIEDGIYKRSAIKWEEGVLFHKGEVVKHNGKFYINTSDHKSNWANIPNINTEERWKDYDPSCGMELDKDDDGWICEACYSSDDFYKRRKKMNFKIGDKVRYKDEHYEGIGEILVDDSERNGILKIDTDEYGGLWFRDDEVFSLTSCDDIEEEREPQCECNHKGYNLSDEYEQAMRDYEILWGEPQDDKEDMINYPKHYNMGEIQTLDYIDDVLINNPELTALDGYYLGNILKYGGTRLGNKGDKKQDMGKMKFYSDRWNKHYE